MCASGHPGPLHPTTPRRRAARQHQNVSPVLIQLLCKTACSTDDTFIASRGSETALEAVACSLCETA